MRLFFLSQLPRFVALTVMVSVLLSASKTWAQALTPGAAAVGGTTTDGQLIAPGGSQTSADTTTTSTTTGSRTVHLPDPNWPIVLPENRLRVEGRALPGAGLASNGATSQPTTTETTPVTTTPVTTTPTVAPVAPTVDPEPTVPETTTEPETTTATAAPSTDTTEVTAGASSASSASTAPAASQVFDQVALDFGPLGVDLTLQHEIALGPVVDLMRQDPLRPLRVVAVLAQAEASDEEAKLLARRRILAVRRYLIEQGLSADNLTFVISANATTEPFANNVLIES